MSGFDSVSDGGRSDGGQERSSAIAGSREAGWGSAEPAAHAAGEGAVPTSWRRAPLFTDLPEAVGRFVHDGQTLALEGFTHLIPFAAGHEIIRQGRRELILVRMTPDLIYDQMIGVGCAARLVFSWGGNPGVGSLHRLRDAVEHGWPRALALEEHSHADMAGRYAAGVAGLPFAVLRGYHGSDLPKYNDKIRTITCPFTGEGLAATPALRPDVTFIHAQQADRRGNVLIQGIVGVQKEAALAARHVVVTVEEVVDALHAPLNACILPFWTVSAICPVPFGAYPSYAHGYYERDNAFYRAWDAIARDRDRFVAWIREHVLGTRTHAEFLRSIGHRPAAVLPSNRSRTS